MKKLLLFFAGLAANYSYAQLIEIKPFIKSPSCFAIIIDQATYQYAKESVHAYKSVIEKDGLATYIFADNWKNPEEIKSVLQKLYNSRPALEGAVFVGEIPVPMLRNAQHLTSAFKMDQSRDWKESSVPSDRFYDDFDLKFQYLKKDSTEQLYFYYSLVPESAQSLNPEIYTARIRPSVPKKNAAQRPELIKRYLDKVVAERSKPNKLDNLMMFRGHGYNSDALESWSGEQVSLREQLPDVFKPGASATFLWFSMKNPIKYDIISEIQRENLDVALFHEHGSEDMQYLNDYPTVSSPQPSIENIKRYLRSKLRSAAKRKQDTTKIINDYVVSLDVPRSWFAGTFSDSLLVADSIFDANLDIHLEDIYNARPNVRYVMFDACFNGSFHLNEYIAGAYVLGNGKTIVAQANTVNSLQDNWPNEFLGLLGCGVRVGFMNQYNCRLETHLIGDPTYRFASPGYDQLNTVLATRRNDAAYWRSQLKTNNPDVQAIALRLLFDAKEKNISNLLAETYFNSPYSTVRMECVDLLSKTNDANFYRVLKTSINDSYELIRRLSVNFIGRTGSDELIPALTSAILNNTNSVRVLGRAKDVARFMNPEKMIAEIEKQISEAAYLSKPTELKEELIANIKKSSVNVNNDIAVIFNKTEKTKSRLFEIRGLRNLTYTYKVPDLVRFAEDATQDTGLRIAGVEALSWFKLSSEKHRIIDMCNRLIASANNNELKEQALKTKNILLD